MTPDPKTPHPKIRARRIEVRRDEGRRRRIRLLVVALVLALVGLAVAVARSPVLDVDHVEVAGTVRTTPAEVRRAARISPGAAMIDLDTGAAAQRIEARPWVARATVERRWPATVEVRVTERRAVAQAAGGGRWRVLDRSGRVLADQAQPDPGLVVLGGVTPGRPGSSVGALPGLALAGSLSARMSAAAASIGEGTDGLELGLRDGITVRFGDTAELDDKLFALDAILTRARRDPPIATIDLRVPSAPVLTRKADDA